jgi:hypothetical protein
MNFNSLSAIWCISKYFKVIKLLKSPTLDKRWFEDMQSSPYKPVVRVELGPTQILRITNSDLDKVATELQPSFDYDMITKI